jgi:glycosyltransferase involved in cell wall biosynthesis
MKQKKVLILTNPLDHEGGIVNYYNLFFKNFKSDLISLKHGSIGSRSYLFYYPLLKRILYPLYYLFDLIVYIFTLLFDPKIKIIQLSPSLIPVPLIRDGLLILLAKLFGKKVVVFYRGWKLPTLHIIAKRDMLCKLFNFIFQKNTLQVVLASSFKNDLEKLNPKKKANIIITTTAIDKSQIIKPLLHKENKPIKVLFLARIQDLKGVEELVDAIGQLKQKEKLNEFKFSIVGHENKIGYTNELKKKLDFYGVKSEKANFLGRISGQEKYQLYASHDIYVLPSYSEGCPNSLLEALASGLFCITTRVGALSDIIIPKVNGLFVNTKDSNDLTNTLLYCSSNKNFNENRLANADKYSSQFDIKEITRFFENKYVDLIENK